MHAMALAAKAGTSKLPVKEAQYVVPEKIKFVYLRSAVYPNEVVTIGYYFNHVDHTVQYKTAKCCATDNFCRRVGRNIVKGRWAKYGHEQLAAVQNHEQMYKHFCYHYHPDWRYTSTHDVDVPGFEGMVNRNEAEQTEE